jgi:hypothetical protein
MTTDTFLFVASILGTVIATLIAKMLWDGHARQKDFLDLQDRVKHFEKLAATRCTRIEELENENTNLRRKEAARIAEEERKNEHARDQQQVAILKILDPHDGRRLDDIAKQCGCSELTAIFHLQSLSSDGFVHSEDYSDDPIWDTGCTASQSTWTIRQPGLEYLASNNMLE